MEMERLGSINEAFVHIGLRVKEWNDQSDDIEDSFPDVEKDFFWLLK